MVIGVLDARHLPDSVTDAWSHLQLAEPTLSSPFFRPEFTQIVAAARGDVYVAVLEDGGFFPFQRGTVGMGRPVGSRLSDYHGLVATPETPVDVQQLLRACRLSTWEFDGLVAAQGAFAPFHQARRSSPVIDLARGHEAYVESRREAGSSIVGEAARKVDRLASRLGPVRFEAHVSDPEIFELLLTWKSAQYGRTGAVDIFRYAWVRDVVRRVHATREPGFAGMLSVLYAGDEPVAAHLGLRSSTVWHWWLPAYDPTHARDSPGIVMLDAMARTAPQLGLTSIDLGKGDALYKRRFANGSIELATGAVQRPSLASLHLAVERSVNAILYRTPARAAANRSSTRRRLR